MFLNERNRTLRIKRVPPILSATLFPFGGATKFDMHLANLGSCTFPITMYL